MQNKLNIVKVANRVKDPVRYPNVTVKQENSFKGIFHQEMQELMKDVAKVGVNILKETK